MSLLDSCEKHFRTRDLYKLFGVESNVAEKDIKKAYYKLSLQVHPDRVCENGKDAATEKFKVLSKIYQVLIDKEKRAVYDESGTVEDEDYLSENNNSLSSLMELWAKIFKPLTIEDFENYEKQYTGTELERSDIKKSYLAGKGCINKMMTEIPFMKVEDEPRIQNIVKEMIAAGEVPEYKIFTEEPKQKRNRRHKKYERESKKAEKIKEELKSNVDQQIMSRQQSRESNFNSLMDDLMKKYGEEDDSDVIDFSKLNKNVKKRQKKKSDKKNNLHSVNNRKIKKQN